MRAVEVARPGYRVPMSYRRRSTAGDRLASAFLIIPFIIFAVLFVIGAAVNWRY
jgi:hypothetical protein